MPIADLQECLHGMLKNSDITHVPKGVAAAAVEHIAAAPQGCSAKVVSMLVWEVFQLFDAEAVSREQALPAMQALASRAEQMPMKLFKPIDVAQIPLNLAKFGLAESKWFGRLAAGEAMGLDWEGELKGTRGVEQSIANTIYGLAAAQCSGASGFIDHLLAIAMGKLAGFKAQECSNMLWGLAKMQHALDSPLLLVATGHRDAALVGTRYLG
jgi:hypothetical protein